MNLIDDLAGYVQSKNNELPDIKPQTDISVLNRSEFNDSRNIFEIRNVSIAVGMQETFIRKICGRKGRLSSEDVLNLLEQDCYRETIVPRSKVLSFLKMQEGRDKDSPSQYDLQSINLIHGHVLDSLRKIQRGSVKCVVTSTPYWGLRIYKDAFFSDWADGERCPYGHEQTPEGFLRHTTEVLAALYEVLADDGSIWWNVMDSFNTRTQIRGNAAEALRAMQGKDHRAWGDHECRRYSAGHSFLKDGEQCLIPMKIADRASQIGYYVKSVITWAKTGSLPEPQESRVSRNLEYVVHLTKERKPFFDKSAYRNLPAALGGRNNGSETDKLSDVWMLSTSSGKDGHGAQFPVALPARCIALSTKESDLVLDPFVGAGNTGVAAKSLGRNFVGIDVSKEYLQTAERKINETAGPKCSPTLASPKTFQLKTKELPL